MRSNSESFKCIEALLKLFMTKQAHEQIKIENASRNAHQSFMSMDGGESKNAILDAIIKYVKRLENYTETDSSLTDYLNK